MYEDVDNYSYFSSYYSHVKRITKTNTECKQHWESRHPDKTFAICFPGQMDPTITVATTSTSTGGGGKADIDLIRAEAREARSIAEGGVPKADKVKKVKPAQDLSFLDASLNTKKK